MFFLDNCACSRIEVYSQNGRKIHHELYGHYLRQAENVNGRPFYKSDAYGGKFGIWWYQDDTHPRYEWKIGFSSGRFSDKGWAINLQDVDCPQTLKHFSWWMSSSGRWYTAGYALGVRCLPDDDRKQHERKFDVIKLDGYEPTSHAITEIREIMTLFISKP